MVPPPRFAAVSFDSFRTDPAQPTQAGAVAYLEGFADSLRSRPSRRPWRLGGQSVAGPGGVYLDGGFGVGKTHLLASLWQVAPGPKLFATFVELTHLVGALGFHQAVDLLSDYTLVCVDEFELDDPGDTVLVSTLLRRLREAGVRLAATSNTLPGKLGEGRFATADFMREIQGLAASFDSVRIDGEDYRHRGLPAAPEPVEEDAVVAGAVGEWDALDRFDPLTAHLAEVHPSRYGAMLDGVKRLGLLGVTPVHDQAVALRLVVLADRLYDRGVPVIASGVPFDRLFTEDLLRGGYRKKYFRAVSRLVALAREGAGLAEAEAPAGEQ
jgi:cell division protein ZapE